MSRVAIKELLSTIHNPALIWPNHALDTPPRDQGTWLVIRYGQEASKFGMSDGPRNVTIWAYQPRQIGTEYSGIDAKLGQVIEVLTGSLHYQAADGSVITMIDYRGLSEDLVDEGYDAIARSASFTVLSRSA